MRWFALACATLLSIGCADNVELAKTAFEKTLSTRDQMSYEHLTEFPGGVVCSKYRLTDEWGARKPGSSFIYRDETLDTFPSKDDWTVFCSEDQAATLHQTFGINVARLDRKILETLRADFADLALRLSTSKGQMVSIPNDPWGSPYLYEEPWYAGVKGDYKLRSLGADNAEGGIDENADISDWQLRYIDHIRSL